MMMTIGEGQSGWMLLDVIRQSECKVASDGRKPTFYLMKMGGTKGGRLSRRFMGIGGGGQLTQSIKTLAENVTGKSTNTIRGMVCVCVMKIKIR